VQRWRKQAVNPAPVLARRHLQGSLFGTQCRGRLIGGAAANPFRMKYPVAYPAKRDQVFFGIITELASGGHVVYFQSNCCPARLAAPMVALQDRLT